MLTDAEHEEVLRAIGFSHVKASLHPSIRPAISSQTVRAQMTDWLLEQEYDLTLVKMGGEEPRQFSVRAKFVFKYRVEADTLAEALARCVLEISRADD